MSQADRIREFVRDRYVALARTEGHSKITIRAGDVHRAMGLANAPVKRRRSKDSQV